MQRVGYKNESLSSDFSGFENAFVGNNRSFFEKCMTLTNVTVYRRVKRLKDYFLLPCSTSFSFHAVLPSRLETSYSAQNWDMVILLSPVANFNANWTC